MRRKWVVPILVVILGLLFTMAALAASDNALGIDDFYSISFRGRTSTTNTNQNPLNILMRSSVKTIADSG